MPDQEFAPGTTVCYRCGSPTFVVLGYIKSKVLLSWFNPYQQTNEEFTANPNSIETIENFNERKIRLETKFNKRIFEIPAHVDPESIVTLGFANPEHKNKFLEMLTNGTFEGTLIGEDKPISMN